MADAAAIQTCPHAAAGPISLTANVHVSAVIPNFEIQEADSFTQPDWVEDVIETPITVSEGEIAVPEKNGLGVEFNEDTAREHVGEMNTEHNIFSASFQDSFE
jgi:galactonate dehydratase